MNGTPARSPLISFRQLALSSIGQSQAEFQAEHPGPVLVLQLPEGPTKTNITSTGVFAGGVPSASKAFSGVQAPFGDGTPLGTRPANPQATGRTRVRLGTALVFSFTKSGQGSFSEMTTIGRAPDNDLVLPFASVSKMHGYFMRAPDGRWRFCDGGSTNGAWHNGGRIEPRGAVNLTDGDELLVGPDVAALFKTPLGLLNLMKLCVG